eukprot:4471775-Pleurochrysis_carterae.AAC.1
MRESCIKLRKKLSCVLSGRDAADCIFVRQRAERTGREKRGRVREHKDERESVRSEKRNIERRFSEDDKVESESQRHISRDELGKKKACSKIAKHDGQKAASKATSGTAENPQNEAEVRIGPRGSLRMKR